MSMGKGMRMYLMAGGGQGEMRRNEQGGTAEMRQGGRQYRMDGEYNVNVYGGGNRNEGGSRSGGNRIGDPRSEYGGGQREMGYSMERGGGQGGGQGGSGRRSEYGGQSEMGYTMERGGGQGGGQGGGGRRSEYGEEAEMRYRGKDGRYHAGTRRSEYGGGEMRRMGGDDDDEEQEYSVTIKPESTLRPMIWPEAPQSEQRGDERYANYGNDGITDRQIGFGAAMTMGGQGQKQPMRMGMAGGDEMQEFDEETAREWVESMQGEDKSHPKGGKWSPEQLEALAKKHGVPTKGKEWWEFYAVVNAMYSDYSEVAKRFNITSPDYYALMALAFIRDKDALPGKVARYWEYIAKK